jgi:glycosyltransferase involved in cell wall biosynthesis
VISIVIPTYNRARDVQQCLETIQAQQFPGLEVIVVDDGSSDDTAEVLQKFPGIVTIMNPGNFGVNYSRNRGIERASGKYILFLDSDDQLAPGSLQQVMQLLEANPQTQHFLFLVSDRAQEFATLQHTRQVQYEEWVRGTVGGDFIHVVATAVMKNYLFFEQFRLYEYLNWLRVFKVTAPQLLAPGTVANRDRDRSDSLTNAARLQNFSVIKGKFESQQLYYTLYHKDLQRFQSKALTNKLLSAIMLGIACNRKKDCVKLMQYGSRISTKLAGSLLLLCPPALMRKIIFTWSARK